VKSNVCFLRTALTTSSLGVDVVCYFDVGNTFLYTVQVKIVLRNSTSGSVVHGKLCVGNLIILQCIKPPGIDKSDADVTLFQNYEDTTPTVSCLLRIYFRCGGGGGSTNSLEGRGQRDRGSGDGSP
jgi:hypothetical protein